MRGEIGLKRTSPSSEREECVTCPQPYPSETRAAPISCTCRAQPWQGLQQPSCGILCCSFAWAKKAERLGSETYRVYDTTPKKVTKIRSLNFTVMPSHLVHSQAKVQGCCEPVFLTMLQTRGFQWISWRYGVFLTLVLFPWQTQLPSGKRHWLILASAPSSLYLLQGIQTTFSLVCYHRLLIHIT